MLEVVVAVLLAGLLLGPLVGAALSAISQAAEVRERAYDPVRGGEEAAAWGYGPCVASALWQPGPELRITIGESEPVLLGLWIEGWFQGELDAAPGADVMLSAALWAGATGKEAVIRVRRSGASWGPPWRSLVAEMSGAVNCSHQDMFSNPSDARVIAHPPFSGDAPFISSWGGVQTAAALPELPPTFLPVPLGTVSIGLCGEVQSWSMEPGRDLDVYY